MKCLNTKDDLKKIADGMLSGYDYDIPKILAQALLRIIEDLEEIRKQRESTSDHIVRAITEEFRRLHKV